MVPLPHISSSLDFLLRRGDCGSFAQNLINQVANTTGNPFFSDYVPDLLKGIVIDFSQQYAGKPVAGRAHPIDDFTGVGVLGLSPQSSKDLTERGLRFRTYEYVETVLHELIHFAGNNGRYTDRQLVEAIGAMGAVPREYQSWYDSLPRDNAEANSRFFDAVLQKHCPGPN